MVFTKMKKNTVQRLLKLYLFLELFLSYDPTNNLHLLFYKQGKNFNTKFVRETRLDSIECVFTHIIHIHMMNMEMKYSKFFRINILHVR